jgi:hypothetical protein
MWDWSSVDPESGFPDFSSFVHLLDFKTIDCPELGESISFSESMGLVSTVGLASQVGFYARITSSLGTIGAGSDSNPISVSPFGTYTGIDVDLLDGSSGGAGDGTTEREPGRLSSLVTVPEGAAGSVIVRAYEAPDGGAVAAHCGFGLAGGTVSGSLVAWDGVAELDCPTSGSSVTLDGGFYSVSASLYPPGDDAATHCGVESIELDGDMTVTIPLGDCD